LDADPPAQGVNIAGRMTPIPLIVDLSEHDLGEGRVLNAHIIPVDRAIPLDAFDSAIREFVRALELAGIALATPDGSIIDLFKKRP
jgi:hypothetical protein